MLWQKLRDEAQLASIAVPEGAWQRPIIHIDCSRQILRCVTENDDDMMSFPVSTSRHGLGQFKDSFRTPAGMHRIAEKIGDNEPVGRVFKARQPTADLCTNNQNPSEDDVITSRILWLDGLQPGFNQGGDVDSRSRYIYIHGTADEAHIGQPASIGCIRMKNSDVIRLFEHVQVNDLVVIE